jgi:hypothetical protein
MAIWRPTPGGWLVDTVAAIARPTPGGMVRANSDSAPPANPEKPRPETYRYLHLLIR